MKTISKTIIIYFFLLSILNANDKVILQLKWFHQFQFAGYYMAKEKGFYQDVGLDVIIRQRESDKNNIKQVISGEANYGISDSILMLYKAKGEPVVVIAPIFQHSPSVLMTLKQSGIDTPYKLNNKKMVFYEDDTDGFSILAMLKKLNINPIFIRKRGKGDYLKLINKEVEASPAYLSNEPYYLKKKGLEFNIINPAHYGFDLYGDILFTSENEIKNYPFRTKKFKEASLKGWEYALDNIEETIELIYKKYSKNKSKEHLRHEANALKDMIVKNSVPLGTLDKGRVQYIYNMYRSLGLINKDLDFENFIFDEFQDKHKIILTKKDKKYLDENRVLKYCIDPSWMPFEGINKNKHTGITADFIKIFKEKLPNNKIVLHKTNTWTESLDSIRKKQCDFIPLLYHSKQREEYMFFTKDYIKASLVIATKLNEPFINDFSKIIKKKIALSKNYAYINVIKDKYPNLNIVEVDNIKQGLLKVKNEEVFAFLGLLPSVAYHIQKEFFGELKITGKLNEEVPLSLGINKESKQLSLIFEKVLNSISKEELEQILNSWLLVKYQDSIDYKTIFLTIVVFTIIICLILYKNMTFKKLNKKLNAYLNIIDKNVLTTTTDKMGNITYVSEAFCNLSQYSKDELIGKKYSLVKHEGMKEELFKKIQKTINSGEIWKGELKNRKKNGDCYWVFATISPLFNSKGEIIGYTSIREDITDKKRIEEISIKDGLTNIYNRRFFNDTFFKFVNSCKRSGELFAFIILDIDYFKQYNDNYGHQKGDEVLINLAKYLDNNLKRSSDYCFRLGGEEFGVLFSTKSKEKAIKFTNKLCKGIENLAIKHEHSNASSYITASFGICCVEPSCINSINEIYKKADEKLYEAKAQGRNRVVF